MKEQKKFTKRQVRKLMDKLLLSLSDAQICQHDDWSFNEWFKRNVKG